MALHVVGRGRVEVETASGFLMIGVEGLMAEHFRRLIGEKTRDALAGLNRHGQRVSRHLPFGHRLAADGFHLESEPEEQATLALIQTLSPGRSLRGLTAALAERSVLARNGRPFASSTLLRLVPNRALRTWRRRPGPSRSHAGLLAIVTVVLETGLRKGELYGLTREGRVWPAGSIRTGFENAVAAAKVDNFHFHDTRHHFASWYVMRRGALPALQQILGHATLAMTMRYSHLSPKHLRDEMAKTERPTAQPVEIAPNRAQDRAHEAVAVA